MLLVLRIRKHQQCPGDHGHAELVQVWYIFFEKRVPIFFERCICMYLHREGHSDAPVTVTVGPPAPSRPQFVR